MQLFGLYSDYDATVWFYQVVLSQTSTHCFGLSDIRRTIKRRYDRLKLDLYLRDFKLACTRLLKLNKLMPN